MDNPLKEMYEAIVRHDIKRVADLLKEIPDLLNRPTSAGGMTWLHTAASKNDVEIVRLLVQKGLDVNKADNDGDVPLHVAAYNKAYDTSRWLLDNGALVDGIDLEKSTPLVSAIINYDFEMVKLLRERGARLDLTFTKNKNNIKDPMSFAVMYGDKRIIQYLKGDDAGTPSDGPEDEITGHIENCIGRVDKLALTEIAGDLQILVVPKGIGSKGMTLVTKRMSEKPMNVPPGSEEFQYAELMIRLPSDWPLDKKNLAKPEYDWPVEWLRKIAHYPFENDTWLGGPFAVIANGEPPMPLGPKTKFTCLLVLAEPGRMGNLQTKDGKLVKFYSLFPLYTEERDLENEKGIEFLLERFQKNSIGFDVDLKRKNVGK